MMFAEEFVRVFLEVKELRLAHRAVHHVVLDQLPIAAPHAAHARLGAAAVDAKERIANGLRPAHEHRLQADTLIGGRRLDAREAAERGQCIEQVNIPLRATAGFDAGALHDERHAPGVLVQILFALQPVPTNGHAVIGGINNVRVVQLAHRLELGEHTADLLVDVFAAGKLPTNLIADGAFIAPLPNARHFHLIAQSRMAVGERMFRQIIDRQLRLLVIGRRQRIPVAMIHRAIFLEQLRRAITHIVRMRKTEVDQERIGIFNEFARVEIFEHPLRMPRAAGLRRAAALGGIVHHLELLVRAIVAVAAFARAHGSVTGTIENGCQCVLD